MSKRINYNLTNDPQGNVGIGTTSPNYKLHVVGNIFASGPIISSSDTRLKTDIQQINLSEEQLMKIQNLKAVTFKMKNDINDNQHIHLGFLAQELEAIIPELVYTDPKTGYKSIAYGNITAILLEYINNLNKQMSELNETIKYLKEKIDQI